MEFLIDMDGVLAKYERHAYTGDNPLFLRKDTHYFAYLQPDEKMIEVTKRLCLNKDVSVYILTSVSNMGSIYIEQVQDKTTWLNTYCPFINTDTQLLTAISSKRDVIDAIHKIDLTGTLTTPDCRTLSYQNVLIDDYNKNLKEWVNAGGMGIKYLNGINSPNKLNNLCTFSGLNLTEDMSADDIYNVLEALIKQYAKT